MKGGPIMNTRVIAFEPTQSLSKILTALLGASAVVGALLSLLQFTPHTQFYGALLDVPPYGVLVGLRLLLFWITLIPFLIWVHQTYRNLSALGAQDLTYSPGWAVGYFFIPF